MSRKIYGVTVGTPMKPQALIEKTEQAQQIEKNTQDIGHLLKQYTDMEWTAKTSYTTKVIIDERTDTYHYLDINCVNDVICDFKANREYLVMWQGEDYLVKSIEMVEDGIKGIVLTSNNAPFTFVYGQVTNEEYVLAYVINENPNENVEVTFSIKEVISQVNKLPRKFLPSVEEQLQIIGKTDTYEWDGDINGLESIIVSDDGFLVGVFKVDDSMDISNITVNDLIGGYYELKMSALDSMLNDVILEFTSDNTVDTTPLGMNAICVEYEGAYGVAFVKEAFNYEGFLLTKGIWLFNLVAQNGAIKIPSMLKMATKCLDGVSDYMKLPQECLPNTVATKDYVEQVILGGTW